MHRRLAKLRRMIELQEVDGILVHKSENRRYFSRFSGSAGVLLVTPHKEVLITDFRYVEQAGKEAEGYEIVKCKTDIYSDIAEMAAQLGVKSLGFEEDFVTCMLHAEIGKRLPGVNLKGCRLDSLRMVKDAEEIDLIREAVDIADQAFFAALSYIMPGVTEQQVAVELEYVMRRLGAEKIAFDIIVASGVRSSLPHGRASDKMIEVGDFVTLDFGAVVGGYHSDMTRTIVVGNATKKQREVYETVKKAQLAAIRSVQPGEMTERVDAAARNIITAAGYGDNFGHGLGHGVGLAIHEEPRLSPLSGGASPVKLLPGMTVTIEPGIYIPDWGGVRIEDTVVVTEDSCEVLTSSGKELIEIKL